MSLELLWGPHLKGGPKTNATSAANQWAGRTALNSGSATVTVSSNLVGSNSLILLGVEAVTDQASGFGTPVEVKSINPGNAFVLGWQDGNAQARDTTVMWMMWRQ